MVLELDAADGEVHFVFNEVFPKARLMIQQSNLKLSQRCFFFFGVNEIKTDTVLIYKIYLDRFVPKESFVRFDDLVFVDSRFYPQYHSLVSSNQRHQFNQNVFEF